MIRALTNILSQHVCTFITRREMQTSYPVMVNSFIMRHYFLLQVLKWGQFIDDRKPISFKHLGCNLGKNRPCHHAGEDDIMKYCVRSVVCQVSRYNQTSKWVTQADPEPYMSWRYWIWSDFFLFLGGSGGFPAHNSGSSGVLTIFAVAYRNSAHSRCIAEIWESCDVKRR